MYLAAMIDATIAGALNEQVRMEAQSSHAYLAMAVWADTSGFDGTAQFLYTHAEEERMHMLKLVQFINERGAKAIVPALNEPNHSYSGLREVFETVLDHETKVTANIHSVVDLCLKVKDYSTHNFMQWYVSEQMEEERLARKILDRLALAGNDQGALYLFDRDIAGLDGEEGKGKEA
jgi:ferritin